MFSISNKSKAVLLILAVLLLLVIGGCSTGGNAVPVTKTVPFTWTAVGDDGLVGQASVYDIRYSTDSTKLKTDWTNCTQLAGEPTPKISGSAETWSTSIDLELGTKYYFALKVGDEVPNWSPLSNIKVVFFPDDQSPSKVADFQ